ncbi:hypothetical protein HHK36_032170 [Tetracentron sinense]|uniref:C3H1-type domain-containing protein n=1 Tax=Tetracentron sinense TaxID=13715 RepID=A0A835CXW1_TETSI|nr:hypothetical protein HHK36_032170 [Tetracentron sinense]
MLIVLALYIYFVFLYANQGTTSPLLSTDIFGSNIVYNSKHQGELGSSGQVHLLSTSVAHVPERLDQKVCHYFVMTGSCKYGTTCKFNHPQEKISPLAISGALGPLGLPLRPGQTICAFYSLYGICNFGPNCKFDHPFTPFTGYSYDYSMSLPPPFIPDPSLYPYQRNSGMAPSSETSPSKPLRLPDRIRKPEAASNKHQNPDTKSPEVLPEQAASPTDTSPISLEPLHEQSD